VIILKKLIYVVLPLFICFSIYIYTLEFHNTINAVKSTEQNLKQPIVIIDAGHGGFDGGAVANDGTVEKDINLSIALYLQEYLSIFDINTIMIRDTDCSVENEGLNTIREKKSSDLHNRMKVMKDTDNAIFVSVHQNKFPDGKYSGTQVFYSPKTKDESQVLAQAIQDYIVNTLQKDNKRQIKECGTSVYLMYNAEKPAVLVECGFLSNYEETQKLKTSEYQKKIAFCIAMGIQNYITTR
jgi:N-acetylmuramoyl-L-alanine amidase